jgi:hypothetical protein
MCRFGKRDKQTGIDSARQQVYVVEVQWCNTPAGQHASCDLDVYY